MNIPQILRTIQKISGLSQDQIAKKIGVSFVAFNNWFTGKANPREKAKQKIIRLYNELTGKTEIPKNILEAKKTQISVKPKKYKNILKTILQNPDIYNQFILSLTYHTNSIEGSTLSEPETAAILFHNSTIANKTLREQLEAKNHQTALEYLFSYLNENKPINEELILKLHSIFLNSIYPEAGFYRQSGVRIVGANIPTANYLKVPQLMKLLVKNIQTKQQDIISYCAKIHSEFEKIHPFSDANGRVGRLILQAMLLQNNLSPAIIKQEKRVQYLKYLNISQAKGDFSLLEDFLCDAVLEGYKILER